MKTITLLLALLATGSAYGQVGAICNNTNSCDAGSDCTSAAGGVCIINQNGLNMIRDSIKDDGGAVIPPVPDIPGQTDTETFATLTKGGQTFRLALSGNAGVTLHAKDAWFKAQKASDRNVTYHRCGTVAKTAASTQYKHCLWKFVDYDKKTDSVKIESARTYSKGQKSVLFGGSKASLKGAERYQSVIIDKKSICKGINSACRWRLVRGTKDDRIFYMALVNAADSNTRADSLVLHGHGGADNGKHMSLNNCLQKESRNCFWQIIPDVTGI
jgi:hypothetical protein